MNTEQGPSPLLTIAIVTRNRAALLRECLESLSRQTASFEWRAFVVDNASDDETFALASAFAKRDRRFTVYLELQLGASRARNRATHEAVTPYVLFVDDECTFPPGYIERAGSLIQANRPACFGGPVLARFACDPPRPSWYKESYGAFSLPENNPPVGPARLSAGNLGASREALLTIGGFPESFGPAGRQMVYGEENVVVTAMWRRYGPDAVLYDPDLFNRHLVRPEKYRWRTIFRESLRRGLARGRLKAHRLDHGAATHDSLATATRRRCALCHIPQLIGGAVLDFTLLRRLTDPVRYPDIRNVVYERWTRYVTMFGVLIGYMRGRRETRSRKSTT